MHALFPFTFQFQVSMVIQEPPSEFFPAAPGISGRVPRRTSGWFVWQCSSSLGCADLQARTDRTKQGFPPA